MSGERIVTDDPTCPTCGSPAERSDTRYGVRHDCCGLRSWGGKPLASPATHKARQAAHAAFDPIWKDGHLPRGAAYKALAEVLGMTQTECHISLMGEADAKRVPEAAAAILDEGNDDA